MAVLTLVAHRSTRRRAPRLAVLLVAFVALVVAGGATSAASSHDSDDTGARAAMSSDTYEARVEQHVNDRRAAHGLPPLRSDSCTDLTAEQWAEQVASTGVLLHQGGASIMSACQVSYAGETLGRGAFGPRTLVRAWMRSPLHRAVLLSRYAKSIGVGSHLDGSGRWVTSASFTRP